MNENYFMGQDGFVWFTGVVEDRNDPSKLGRVKVRCLGLHTESLVDIPTEDLPWAHIMQSTNNPSMQGLGNTPSFLVEGSWVVGFFLDAVEKQQPLIIGSLPGKPTSVADASQGFNDPNSKYPSEKITHSNHSINEPDTNRLAQGIVSETHKSLERRRKNKLTGTSAVPTAGRPGLNNSQEFSTPVANGKWSEPHPKSVFSNQDPYPSAKYPFNHVQESESGHVFEIDDTPDNERLYREHMSGTFEEIHPQGTRVTKVVYDDYEIIARNKKIVINAVGKDAKTGNPSGALDLTVYGSVRQYVDGDYTLDITGNYIRRVGLNEIVKIGGKKGADGNPIGGNMETEIVNGSYNLSVDKNYIATIGQILGDIKTTVSGNEKRTIGGTQEITVTSDISVTSLTASIVQTALQDFGVIALNDVSIVAGNETIHGSGKAVTINYEDNVTEIIGGTLSQSVTGAVTETYSSSLTTRISGITGISYGQNATHHYLKAFKEKIDGDTFVDAAADKVDHVHPTSGRSGGTDEVAPV